MFMRMIVRITVIINLSMLMRIDSKNDSSNELKYVHETDSNNYWSMFMRMAVIMNLSMFMKIIVRMTVIMNISMFMRMTVIMT